MCILYIICRCVCIILFSSWGDMLIDDGPWKVEVRHWLALDDLDLKIADEASIRSLCRSYTFRSVVHICSDQIDQLFRSF